MTTRKTLAGDLPVERIEIDCLANAQQVQIDTLKPYAENARAHPKRQLNQLTNSIRKYGFVSPILIQDDGTIIAGHGRVEAAKMLGMSTVPAVRASHLDEMQCRALRVADNRLAECSTWDIELLAEELQGLIDVGFEIEDTGFAIAEADTILLDAEKARTKAAHGPEDRVPEPQAIAVTVPGDLWNLGRHRLICGDSLKAETYTALMGDEKADMVFTDPPYNVHIDGFVGGGGAIKHREFAMASGEMTDAQFEDFLTTAHECIAAACRDGAIIFTAMDWRGVTFVYAAAKRVRLELKNLCVWAKTNAGQGGFYRSQHELIVVLKVGTAPHTNTFGLGETGRYRSNVWSYAGVNTFRKGRMEELAMHPTAKPVAMIRDAILDVSRRGERVLDAFGGSGTTLIAAETCGREARLIELDPLYCDVIVRRWEKLTGKRAVRAADGVVFEDAELAAGIVGEGAG